MGISMIVDFYDDLGETFFQSLNGEAPEMLKTAEWRENYDLLDRDFAAILVDRDGKEYRKYACFDAGNTVMSMWYLNHFKESLPPAVVKVAASNLVIAAEHHGIEVPQEILDMNTESNPEWAKAILDERRVIYKAGQAPMMPGMMGGAIGQSMTGGTSPIKTPPMMSKTMPMTSPKPGVGATTSGAGMTVTASSPFDVLLYAEKNWDDLDAPTRRDFAVYLQKEGSAVGVVIPSHISKYGGETLNPRFESLMNYRKCLVNNDEIQEDYDRLGKMASAMEPEDVVEALSLLDSQSSLTTRYGTRIPDPILCVYGREKHAEWSWNHGTHKITEKQLRLFASAPKCGETIGQLFTSDICNKFKADPLGTFKAMPLEHQVIVSRLATQSGIHNDGGVWV
jgi:hypothetical protein